MTRFEIDLDRTWRGDYTVAVSMRRGDSMLGADRATAFREGVAGNLGDLARAIGALVLLVAMNKRYGDLCELRGIDDFLAGTLHAPSL